MLQVPFVKYYSDDTYNNKHCELSLPRFDPEYLLRLFTKTMCVWFHALLAYIFSPTTLR